jgi:uncharacterized protein (TIGR03083 family)
MEQPVEILLADRFPALRRELLHVLADLSEDDWERPTAAPLWSVKDIAAHLLGGDVWILSGKRDGFRPPDTSIQQYAHLVELVNRLNAEWVLAARRMSPRLLTEFLAFTGPEVEAYFASLNPMMMGGPVSWAGPEPAPVWFDIAREFTERWHHQQQIRDATGRPPLYDPHFLSPVLDTFVRGLPHSFRHTTPPAGTAVRFEISGDAGGVWFLQKQEQSNLKKSWALVLKPSTEPAAEIVLPQDIAWRVFTKGIDREKALAQAVIRGDALLASPIFATTAIIG